MNFSPLVVELVKGVFTLAAVLIGSFIALRLYFRQKEYELAKQRYLEGGVDVVAAELDTVFGSVSHNYARALDLCKSFRDTGEHFQVDELTRGFLQLDQSKFHQVAHYRVGSLIGCNLVWDIYQAALAEANSANSVIVQQIPEAIRILSQRDASVVDRESVSSEMVLELRKSHDGCFKYATLSRELHALGLLLEAERLDLKAIAKFPNRDDVKALVANLRSAFPSDESDIAEQ